ncbi:MAG: CRISPR system precrRNA processing endoribonuclease RAMP protein Cas6 [Syntrophobacterales bacterium]|nr:CRISPR system precrRNA processing endoribonuclease RAMP protein Cas6 [Syntrophobacterales bacterium]
MLYGRYVFSCKFLDEAELPEYKGSTFRGVFGHALKKTVCALKHQGCEGCLLRPKCIYVFLFETPFPVKSNGRKRLSSPPHPYVIEPPETPRVRFQPEDLFEFTLLLFGRANEYLPYIIYAFEQTGGHGIGKRVNGRAARFKLENVSSGGDAVYSSSDATLRARSFTEELTEETLGEEVPADEIELRLVTPLRVKFGNSLKAELPFHVLVRAMLRRISSLFEYYGAGEPSLDYRGLVDRAKNVAIKESAIEWIDWKRYSNRQDQSMLMGGITGSIRYAGNLSEFIPLIRFCEKVHLGKQTTFGLGKISLKSLSTGKKGRKEVEQ